MSHQNKN